MIVTDANHTEMNKILIQENLTRTTLSIEFDTPANRIVSQFSSKNKFRIDTSLPDIAFLRQLSVQGRMRYFQGSNTTDINIVPNIGETLFIGGGSWGGGTNALITITISNDSNTRETIIIPSGTINHGVFTFGIDSLVGDNIKAFNVTANLSSQFNIWGWVENTSRIRDVTT